MEKTEKNFSRLMYGFIDKARIDQKIEDNQFAIENGFDKYGQFKKDLDYLLKLKGNKHYQNDSLPRGIENIILQTIEVFSFWHSVNAIDSNFFLIQNNFIHNLVNVSITSMVSCELAKLFNNKPEDFSLNNIWDHNEEDVRSARITTEEEISYISEQFKREDSTRDQAIKRFLDFRNKSIAHNSNNTAMNWSDFIKTVNFIVRAWGVLDKFYSPNCSPRPIQLSDNLYSPLQPHFRPNEISKMKETRLEIMNNIFKAASTNLVTGEIDSIQPFGDLKISINIGFS